MDDNLNQTSQFLFYTASDGDVKVQVILGDETVWSTLKGMSDIFGVEENTIGYHVKNVYESDELIQDRTTRKIRVVRQEGTRQVNRELDYYNLDMIISVGYRVNSGQATKFRIWATEVLKQYLVKGFALNDDRLKQGSQLFGKDYFDELLERIRESERRSDGSIKKLLTCTRSAALITTNIHPSARFFTRPSRTNFILLFTETPRLS